MPDGQVGAVVLTVMFVTVLVALLPELSYAVAVMS
ncbi:Uncharacterised protein [uncultured archaeon]|nr:Uncharacterised protein [uncultured archaeon]